MPVYGTPLTLGFVRDRLREHGLAGDARGLRRASRPASARSPSSPSPMTHSIPDAVGLAIRTPVGTVVHTGDFKLDQTPLDGRLPDLGRLAELGARGRAAPPVRLDQRRAARRHAVGAHGRRAPRADLPRGDGPRPRHDLLVAHPPHAAGDRPRGALRPQGGARRPEPRRRTSAIARDLGLLHVPDGTLVDLGVAARPAARARSRSSRPAARPRRPRRSCASRWTRTSR